MYVNSAGVVLKESEAATIYSSAVGGSKSVFGSRFNDVLYGFTGSILAGGAGDDSYVVWDQNFTINENAGDGVDTLATYAWGKTVLPRNVENLFLRGGGSTGGVGNDLNNIIVAGDANATLDGGRGSDVLVGGKGADIFAIKAGNGSDAVVNFQTGWDIIKLDGYKFSSFDQIRSSATQVGADTIIALGQGEQLVLRDVAATSLSAADFGFSSIVSGSNRGGSTLVGPGAAVTTNGVTLLNNAWGAGDLKYGTDFTIQSAYTAGNTGSGITFNWTFPASTEVFQTVKAYPEIIFGASPYGGATTYADAAHSFPVKVSDIGALTATFDTSITGNKGGFNVAFDIWLTSKPFGDASTITNEVMIWTHRPATQMHGTKIGTFDDGVNSGSIWHEGSYTALVLDTETPRGTIDIAAVLDTLKKLGIVADSEYLASVQFGSEVMGGTGSLSINNFEMNLQTTDAAGNVVVKEISGAGTNVYQQKAAVIAPEMRQVTDSHGVLTGYNTISGESANGKTIAWYDTAGRAIGTDVVKIAGSSSTTEHYDAAKKLVSIDMVSNDGPGVVRTNHFDASYKWLGADIVETSAGGRAVSHYDQNGTFLGKEWIRTSGSTEVTEHYNTKWQFTGAEMTWHNSDGTTLVSHINSGWATTGYDSYSAAGGIATARHLDANKVLTGGSETHVDTGGVTVQTNFDKAWAKTDTVYTATSGNDVISVKAGTNAVHGGTGSDRIVAGSGADTFHFDTAIGKDVDTIVGFSTSGDALVLDHNVFTGLAASGVLSSKAFAVGATAQRASDRIIYDDNSGNLYFDADGSGGKAAILFAHLDPHLALTAANFHMA